MSAGRDETIMRRIAFIVVASLTAISSSSVSAQTSNSPANDIDCNAFTKQGPDTWVADGTVHLKINGVDITYNNTRFVPGTKTTTGVDIYALLESMCGGH
jgi:phosphate-selective porin